MRLFERFRERLRCWRYGHVYQFLEPTLGGDWIRCVMCNHVEEYLPGIHEVDGYVGYGRSWME